MLWRKAEKGKRIFNFNFNISVGLQESFIEKEVTLKERFGRDKEVSHARNLGEDYSKQTEKASAKALGQEHA